MHTSVIEARTYREREKQRRDANVVKRQRQGIARAFGLEPALTPCLHPEGNHRQRHILNRPDRQERRAWRIARALIATLTY